MHKDKEPYQWDFSGACSPGGPAQLACGQQTFSVGIFQWVPKAGGKGLKKSAVKYRLKGSFHNPEELYARAQAKCDELNRHDK